MLEQSHHASVRPCMIHQLEVRPSSYNIIEGVQQNAGQSHAQLSSALKYSHRISPSPAHMTHWSKPISQIHLASDHLLSHISIPPYRNLYTPLALPYHSEFRWQPSNRSPKLCDAHFCSSHLLHTYTPYDTSSQLCRWHQQPSMSCHR